MSKNTMTEPAYVNLQPNPVRIFDENRVPLEVHPWERRGTIPDVTFVVRGAFYQQFVSGSGPLYPFPGHPSDLDGGALEPAPTNERHDHTIATREDARLMALRGKPRLSADVVRSGEVVGETSEEFMERVRRELARVGISTAETFIQASSSVLLSCASINDDNLARVRESVKDLFPKGGIDVTQSAHQHSTTPIEVPDPLPEDEVPDAPDLSDLDTAAGDFDDEEEDDEEEQDEESGYQTYQRSEIDKMTVQGLKDIITEEEFDIDLNQKKVDLKTALLDALEDYDMLDDDVKE